MSARLLDRWRRQVGARGRGGAVWYVMARVVAILLMAVTPGQLRRARGVRELDRAYDDRCDVDTGGVLNPNELGVSSERRRLAVSYVASVPEEFRRTVESVALNHADFAFVDLGSGKGRVVLMAMGLPFKKVIGVEFSPLLHEVAVNNLRRYRGEKRCTDVEFVCADAAEWEPPDMPLALYMYNPFQAEVLREVMANLRESVLRSPRPVYVFYCNPVHEDVLRGEAFLERAAAGNLFVVYRSREADSKRV